MRSRPSVIAHRGASGYLPEHTLQAKALAYAQGADFLEQDVVASRDGELVVCHDIFLDRLTNVHELYPTRARLDGYHYVIDFDWEELKQLEVQRSSAAERETGDPSVEAPIEELLGEKTFRLCRLEDEIDFIGGLNRSSGRTVGIYPEIKHPQWHADHGFDLTKATLELLARQGYEKFDDAIYLQCFDAAELKRVRHEFLSQLRLIQLVGRSTNEKLLCGPGLAEISRYAVGLGANYRQLLHCDEGGEPRATPLVEDARTAGLELHPYTLNRENLPEYASDLAPLVEIVYDILEPEAVFCDYPDIAVELREIRRREHITDSADQ